MSSNLWTEKEKRALAGLESKTLSEKLQFLEAIGIYNKDGSLTKRYGGTKTDAMAQLSKEFDYTHAYGVCLWDVKNQMNVGAAIRAAGAFNANFVNIVGDRWMERKHPDWRNLDTEMAHKKLPVFMSGSVYTHTIPYGFKVIAVERGEGTNYLDFVHPRRAVYVFGPEDGRVPLLPYNDTISINSAGSLNLSACVNIVLASRYSQNFNVNNRSCKGCGSENVSLETLHCNSCGEDID